MAKRKSDTLSQREFAQNEFLKLKKMQSGELDAGPKPSEMAVPLTFSQKIKNLWYHDKFAIIVVGILVVAIALLITQCATKKKYDLAVVVFTHTITGDPNCEKMEEYLQPFCKDINGDGEVNVNVINCTINSRVDSNHSYQNRTSMQSIVANDASALLFITDESSYKEMMEISTNIRFFEGEPIVFQDDFYEFCVDESGFYETPTGLQISCRTVKGAAIEDDKDVDLYYQNAQNVLKALQEKYKNTENKNNVDTNTEDTTSNEKQNVDLSVLLYTHKVVDDAVCEKISEFLKPHCDDTNGDGDIVVKVINCSVDITKDDNQSNTTRMKMLTVISTDASTLLFVTDNDSYNELMSFSDSITFFENDPIVFQNDFYEFCIDENNSYEISDGLKISCRTIKGTSIESDKSIETYYNNAQNVLNNLLKTN